MNTFRLKNIVIIILLFLNVSLLVLLLSRRADEYADHERTAQQLSELFAANGIELDPAVLPREAPRSALESLRSTESEAAFASALLGSVTSVDSGGGIYRYYNTDGTSDGFCLIRSNGSVELSAARVLDDPEAFVRSVCSDFGYALLDSSILTGTGAQYYAVRSIDGAEVYNCTLTFSFTGNTLTAVSGSFLPAAPGKRGEDALDAVSALVRFLDFRNASGAVCTSISALQNGYLMQGSSGSTSLRLSPTWRIETDLYSYYVNSLDNQVTQVT